MKYKYLRALAAVVCGLTLTLLAAEKAPPPLSSARVIHLKAGNFVLADVRVPKGTSLSVTANQSGIDTKAERQVAKGDVVIKIYQGNRAAVVVKADEMEMVPE